MLTCVDRVKDKSGHIIEYVFNDGTRVKPEELKKQLKVNPNLVSNLSLSADNRVLVKSVKSEKREIKAPDDIVKEVYKLNCKQCKLSKDEFAQILRYIELYLGMKMQAIRVKDEEGIKLQKQCPSAIVRHYTLGPYFVKVQYVELEKDKPVYRLDTQTKGYEYLNNNGKCVYWTVKLYYGSHIYGVLGTEKYFDMRGLNLDNRLSEKEVTHILNSLKYDINKIYPCLYSERFIKLLNDNLGERCAVNTGGWKYEVDIYNHGKYEQVIEVTNKSDYYVLYCTIQISNTSDDKEFYVETSVDGTSNKAHYQHYYLQNLVNGKYLEQYINAVKKKYIDSVVQ